MLKIGPNLPWSLRRRLLIVSVVLGVIIILSLTLFFIFRAPANCYDGKQNQNEQGVDCGGVCQSVKVCSDQVSPLVVWWSRVFSLRPGQVYAVAVIQNRNSNLRIRSLSYDWQIVDDEDKVLATSQGETFVEAGETFVLYQPSLAVSGRAKRAYLRLAEDLAWSVGGLVKAPVKIIAESYQDTPRPLLTAQLTNTSAEPIRELEVSVLLLDENNNVYGASQTVIKNLSAATTRQLSFSWPESFDREPATIQFYPRSWSESE